MASAWQTYRSLGRCEPLPMGRVSSRFTRPSGTIAMMSRARPSARPKNTTATSGFRSMAQNIVIGGHQ